MDNWRKFGNPDGKQPMEVSIALPTFLLEKEHHNTILIIYLIAMVVVIPCEGCCLPGYQGMKIIVYQVQQYLRHQCTWTTCAELLRVELARGHPGTIKKYWFRVELCSWPGLTVLGSFVTGINFLRQCSTFTCS